MTYNEEIITGKYESLTMNSYENKDPVKHIF